MLFPQQLIEHIVVGVIFKGIVYGLQGQAGIAGLECGGEDMVAELGVLRQQRAVAVGAEDIVIPHALSGVGAVVAIALQHGTQGLYARAQVGMAAVVLKAHHGAAPGGFAALEGIVAYHAGIGADGIVVHCADKVALVALVGLVIVAQHLEAAADAKEGLAILHSGYDLCLFATVQVLQQDLLLKILAAANEKQVEVGKICRCAYRDLCDRAPDAPALEPLAYASDVAPVAVKVEHIGIEVANFKFLVQFRYLLSLLIWGILPRIWV